MVGIFSGMGKVWRDSELSARETKSQDDKCKWGKYCNDWDELIKCPECMNYTYCDQCEVCYHPACEKYDQYVVK